MNKILVLLRDLKVSVNSKELSLSDYNNILNKLNEIGHKTQLKMHMLRGQFLDRVEISTSKEVICKGD